MVRNDCIDSICSSLQVLGQQKLSDDIRSAAQDSRIGLEDLAACFNSFAAKYSNERFDRYFRRAKVGTPCYIDDILDVPERKLCKSQQKREPRLFWLTLTGRQCRDDLIQDREGHR